MSLRPLISVPMFIIGMGIFCGSCGIGGLSRFFNTQGDGIAPHDTLTAFALGFERYEDCDLWRDRGGGEWICHGTELRHMGGWGIDTPLSRAIATHTYWPFEWLLSMGIMLAAVWIALPGGAKKHTEKLASKS